MYTHLFFDDQKLFGRDGLHFTPEDTRNKVSLQNRIADHQVLEPFDGEIANILQDSWGERRKLAAEHNENGDHK